MSKRTGSLPKQPQRRCRNLVIQITISILRISPLLRSYGPHAEVYQSNSSNSNSDNDNNNDPYFMNKEGGEEMRGSTSTSSSIRSPSRNVKKEDGDDDQDYNSESVRKRESGRTITTSIPSGTSLQESGRTPCFRDFNPLIVLISNRFKRSVSTDTRYCTEIKWFDQQRSDRR